MAQGGTIAGIARWLGLCALALTLAPPMPR
jgi:hypothetical protein